MRKPTFRYCRFTDDFTNKSSFYEDHSENWYVTIKDFHQKIGRQPFKDWRWPRLQKGDIVYLLGGGETYPGAEKYHHVVFEDAYHRRYKRAKLDFDRRVDSLTSFEAAILGIDPELKHRCKFYYPGMLQGYCAAPGDWGCFESSIPRLFVPWKPE